MSSHWTLAGRGRAARAVGKGRREGGRSRQGNDRRCQHAALACALQRPRPLHARPDPPSDEPVTTVDLWVDATYHELRDDMSVAAVHTADQQSPPITRRRLLLTTARVHVRAPKASDTIPFLTFERGGAVRTLRHPSAGSTAHEQLTPFARFRRYSAETLQTDDAARRRLTRCGAWGRRRPR